jgi:hypothetical protein
MSVDDSLMSYSIVSTRRARLIIFVFYKISYICYVMIIIPTGKVDNFSMPSQKNRVHTVHAP